MSSVFERYRRGGGKGSPAGKVPGQQQRVFQVDSEDESDGDVALLVSAKAANAPQPVQPMMMSQDDDMLLLGGAAPSAPPPPPPGMPIERLPWKGSRDDREGIVERFQKHLEFEMISSDSLHSSLLPFMEGFEPKERKPSLAPHQYTPLSSVGGLSLRNYQHEGVKYLAESFAKGIGCILADDMGLGKTAQICSFLRFLQQSYGISGPHLIVAPLSTISAWMRELTRWAPGLQVVKMHGDRGARSIIAADKTNRHSVFVTTPATLLQETSFFKRRVWNTCIVDEAHCLKSSSTNINRVCCKLTSAFRVAVTGTPIQNSVEEFCSLMKFLFPKQCKRLVFDPNEVELMHDQCAKVLKHIMLRRTKDSLQLEIPPRTDEPVSMIEPTPIQTLLLQMLSDSAGALDGEALSALFMHVRKACNHPLLIPLLQSSYGTFEERLHRFGIEANEHTLIHSSAKMMHLDGLLRKLKEETHRVLIFSNFTTQLDILQAFCDLRGYSYERLDGAASRVERELAIHRYNYAKSKTFVFLVSTMAGGVGVTLTGADTVILYDAHFNPQIDRQAADRAHRLGQTRPVTVYRFCLHGTAEERVLNVAHRKAAMGDMIVDGVETASVGQKMLSHSELRSLLLDTAAVDKSQSTLVGWENALCESIRTSLTTEDETEKKRAPVRAPVMETHVCFDCGGRMKPLEPLLHCTVCPKAYHPDCIDLPASEVKKARFVCPRHRCSLCEKPTSADGALFLCASCPTSFCYDCLDSRYLEVDVSGQKATLKHISDTYPGMEDEGVGKSRSTYYITCLRCNGIETSSEDGDDESTECWSVSS